MPAARAWSRYEGACSTLRPSAETVAAFADPRVALGLARAEAHYFVNGCFMPAGALLADAPRLEGLPGAIFQGRHDIDCPTVAAHPHASSCLAAQTDVLPGPVLSPLET